MAEASIIIPVSAYKAFDPSVQSAIMTYIIGQFGGPLPVSGSGAVLESSDEKGLARLDVPEAKLFLNNCSEKSTSILQEIVNRNGDFMASEIANLVGTSIGELRGAWSGLTKRVRTISKNPEAKLLNWFKHGDSDWRGIMAAQTVASMRVALNERG
ncbi:hypothetical protein LB554_24935 [Mesorhizobium sp. CO1-1-11]|uniref:hypothetical protein n=1 Tax=Mesorhizobium sp. CO1-1-11 TaxID=2876636 RepID=UPI001CCA439B|nr:hypothetical protein [Mesorhizobium sp. CO1-1-11]MBZ9727194.1 hypothetical protein [Mesorhizobium sp. CO1-1-11]